MKDQLHKDIDRICEKAERHDLKENEKIAYVAHQLMGVAQEMIVRAALSMSGDDAFYASDACRQFKGSRKMVENMVRRMLADRAATAKGVQFND